MKTIETTGKDIEQAIMSGLAELGCTIDDVDVKILQHPGIFRKARVSLTYYGTQETVETKTAASVMRNLQERAAKASEENSAKPKFNRDRKQERVKEGVKESAAKDSSKDGAKERSRDNRGGRSDNNYGNRDVKEREGYIKTTSFAQAFQKNSANAATDGKKAADGARQKPDFKTRDAIENSGIKPAIAPSAEVLSIEGKKEQMQLSEPAKKAALMGADRKPIGENKVQAIAENKNSGNSGKGITENAEKSEKSERAEKPVKTVSAEFLQGAAAKASDYLKRLSELMGEKVEVAYNAAGNTITAELKTENQMFIGNKGVVLDAMEHLAAIYANGGDTRIVHVDLDCCNYRAMVNAHLHKLANEAAAKAIAANRRVAMPAMNSANRRIVHAALSDRTDVITRSEGKDPHRFIVIIPKTSGREPRENRDNRGKGSGNFGGKNRHGGGNKNFHKNPRSKDNSEE